MLEFQYILYKGGTSQPITDTKTIQGKKTIVFQQIVLVQVDIYKLESVFRPLHPYTK